MGKRSKRSSDEEDERINAGIAADPDTFEADDLFFQQASPAPQKMQALTRKYRGKQKSPVKKPVSLRINEDILIAFKENSLKYGPTMEEALQEFAIKRGWLTRPKTKKKHSESKKTA
jgi:uncharacterized protein (DUF4415 family)